MAKKRPRISASDRKLLRALPGYDPFEQSKGFWFDPEAAKDATIWIERYCTFTQGAKARQKFLLEYWQKSIIKNLFGWKREDGTRRFREMLLFVPRKNGKSELAAAIIAFVLFTDPEPGAQIFSVAAKRDQTKYVFDPVCRMIKANPKLLQRSKIFRSAVTVDDRSYRTLASDANTEHGGSTHLAVIDELHAQPTRELVDVIQTSMGGRTQPLLICTTTSDFDREGSVCNKTHDYAEKVRDGIIEDPSFLPVIYQADREDDWSSPAVWSAANPNLGISVSKDFIASQCRRAKEEPSFENTFRRLHLNVRTEQAYRWIPMVDWDACDDEVDLTYLAGRPCYGGLDLGAVNDMSAFVLLFPGEDKFDALPFFWCPEDTAEIRERKDRQPYVTWSRQGLVELTPGNTIDNAYILRRIKELGKIYNILEIAFDSWNASMLCQMLSEDCGFKMIEFRQGTYSMNEPCKYLLAQIMKRNLRHGGHPVLRWNASNMAVYANAENNIKPDKSKSWEKIDGMVSLIMAYGRAMIHDTGESVYEERGLVVL